MYVSTPLMNRMLAAYVGASFAPMTVMFVGYLGRTLYVALIGENAAAYRSGTVLALAIFFAAAAAGCASVSFKFLKMARRGFQGK